MTTTPGDDDPLAWTLVEAADAVRTGAISSETLTGLCLERIDQLQPSLNAFISVDGDRAMASARAADSRLASGAEVGPLHGVPLAHKDMFYRAGAVTTGGSRIWRDRVREHTAEVLIRLDAAGAIELGRLNLSEFALGPTGQNAHHGRACNPWDPAVITGGSSSGSAAAVAAGMAFAALGSDTGGSIRLPAALCGVAGLKPGHGRVSTRDVMPLAPSMDCVGPLARSVADLALIFAVLTDTSADAPPKPAWAAAALADRPSLQGVRIGIPAGLDRETLDAEVAASLAESRADLEALGARSVTIAMPDIDTLCDLANTVSMYEAARTHAGDFATRPEDYGPQVRSRLAKAHEIGPEDYARALKARPEMLEVMATAFEACDVIHMPVLGVTPPRADAVDVDGGPALAAMIASLTRFCRPISYLGLPALAQPSGFTRAGLPLSMQWVAPPLAEAALFAIGGAFERLRGPARPAIRRMIEPHSRDAELEAPAYIER
jgi:aspartyl-tRNA(Asn)/glutamyl-tRNA(Gln) amidotransferase subunit A